MKVQGISRMIFKRLMCHLFVHENMSGFLWVQTGVQKKVLIPLRL